RTAGSHRGLSSPRSLRVFPPLVLHLLPLAIVVRVQKLTSTTSLVRVREGRRLQREKQQLKIPEEVAFASEEAEALPAESIRPDRSRTAVIAHAYAIGNQHALTSQFISTANIKSNSSFRWDKYPQPQSLGKEALINIELAKHFTP